MHHDKISIEERRRAAMEKRGREGAEKAWGHVGRNGRYAVGVIWWKYRGKHWLEFETQLCY